jgi:hypothetical protein
MRSITLRKVFFAALAAHALDGVLIREFVVDIAHQQFPLRAASDYS